MDLFQTTPRCRCESCSPEPLPTYGRAWMRECLVRDIARMPIRSAFLADFGDKHGTPAAERLADDVRAELGRMRELLR